MTSKGIYIYPASVNETGKWVWHGLYEPMCPHGKKIPQYITDRVKTDFNIWGLIVRYG